VRLVTRQTSASSEGANTRAQLTLLAFELVKAGLPRGQLDEKTLDQGGDRRVALGGFNPGSPVSFVVHRNCDILHIYTVAPKYAGRKRSLTPRDGIRDVREDVRDQVRAQANTDAFQQSRRERKKIEMRFAHMKRILRLDRLRLRSLSGARDEVLLTATVQNLRRLAKLLSQPPRLAAAA
jgi:Transposase DDE domain